MLVRLVQIVSGFTAGYLCIKWIHIPEPFILGEFISAVILEPHFFFAATVAFLGCFLIHAGLIRGLVSQAAALGRKENINNLDLFLCCQAVTSLGILFTLHKVLAVLLFSFSMIYGMISIDFSEKGKNKQSGS
ncbi:hypothetical protein [Peribacillus deserti]|uniref:Uncharacterized protein n=1 Tax=Peribacillus deserti TaxID=673318 RepID=A0A2N5M1R1_9BACI|nr:hypothetical protein [Peribacillus deserti]PLT28306.1 hypothetical protein CUU66_18985 [Peribacillus deserti]